MIHLALFSLLALADTGAADGIAATINKDLTPFKACYYSNTKPGASGKVVTHFTVGADGKVTKAEVSSSELKNEKLEACVADAIKALVFPAPAGGASVQVEYPFVFQPDTKVKAKKKPKG